MLVGASENTLGLAADYLKWVALGAPSIVLSITASNLVRGEGAAKESMIGSVIGQITNIILDPIFILHTGDKLFGINMPFDLIWRCRCGNRNCYRQHSIGYLFSYLFSQRKEHFKYFSKTFCYGARNY